MGDRAAEAERGGRRVLSILGIDLGVSEGGPVIWPACRGKVPERSQRPQNL